MDLIPYSKTHICIHTSKSIRWPSPIHSANESVKELLEASVRRVPYLILMPAQGYVVYRLSCAWQYIFFTTTNNIE